MTTSSLPSPDKIVPPPVAVEFVDSLRSLGVETLVDWLRANNAPQEAIDLASNCDYFSYYMEEVRRGPMTEIRAFQLGVGETIVSTINAIAALGGSFHDGNGATQPRNDPIKWEPPVKLMQFREAAKLEDV